MTGTEKTPEQRVEELNRAFGSSTGDRPHFKAEHEGDEYLFGRRPQPKHRATVTFLARVGDSDVLNEIATIEQTLVVEAITDETRCEGESETAVARVMLNLAAALRAAAGEIETSAERADTIERMRAAYTEAWEAEDARQAQARRDGTWVKTGTPHARSRAGITAALNLLESRS